MVQDVREAAPRRALWIERRRPPAAQSALRAPEMRRYPAETRRLVATRSVAVPCPTRPTAHHPTEALPPVAPPEARRAAVETLPQKNDPATVQLLSGGGAHRRADVPSRLPLSGRTPAHRRPPAPQPVLERARACRDGLIVAPEHPARHHPVRRRHARDRRHPDVRSGAEPAAPQIPASKASHPPPMPAAPTVTPPPTDGGHRRAGVLPRLLASGRTRERCHVPAMQLVSPGKVGFPPAHAAIPGWLQRGGRLLAQRCFPTAQAHPSPACPAMLAQLRAEGRMLA